VREILIGGAAAFAVLVFNKAVAEPLAKNVGRRLIDLYVGPCCKRLDYLIKSGLPDDFRRMGVEFSFEEQVRDFLDMAPEALSDDDVERIVAEVFRLYDLRLIN
jgi:hypothetical protein